MKKAFLIGLIVVPLLIASIVFLVWWFTPGPNDAPSAYYDEEIKVLNESYPSDIIVYGEDIGFDSKLNFRTIDKITEENLKSEPQYKYTFFVINDRNGTLQISDEEFELCKRLCDENDLNFYYIGEQYLYHLSDFGFFDDLYIEGTKGIGYIMYYETHIAIHGLWTSVEEEYIGENPRLLGQILAFSFVDHVIKRLN